MTKNNCFIVVCMLPGMKKRDLWHARLMGILGDGGGACVDKTLPKHKKRERKGKKKNRFFTYTPECHCKSMHK